MRRKTGGGRFLFAAAFTCATVLAFVAAASGFFLAIGQPPLRTLVDMIGFAVGDAFSLSETLLKTSPVLLCALATILPARLGLVSVGAEGQLYLGALTGTGIVIAMPAEPGWLLIPLMLIAGAAGGALWGLVPGLLRTRFDLNETITTLLLNYVAVLFVSALVYGPWKDPANLGWPATINFPASATLPPLPGTRIHLGFAIGIVAAFVLFILLLTTRWGLALNVLRGNARVGAMIGLSFSREALVVMAMGGAFAGIAGIAETSAVQGRLQPGISVGYGLTGFLVAWLSGHNPLIAVPVSFLIGGLIAAGDSLQLFAKVPAASVTVLQGLLFAIALAASGLAKRRGRHG